MQEYAHKKIEKKWQKVWKETRLYKTKKLRTASSARQGLSLPADWQAGIKDSKFYILDMFPYPSGEGLHVGHPKGYIATDVVSRMKRMQGHAVLHPMGFDAFGLPAENYAIKTKTNPETAVKKNVARYKKQLELLGFDYDWSREINTTDPNYYKWTQWIFLQLFKRGLAYQSHEPINWCPSCKTGLANEDVEDGKCERCGAPVEKKPMRQWVLKITDYAERLLKDIEKLDWPENIKEQQRNWIGRSDGMLFTAPVKDTNLKIQTFSAHFEAFRADTFVVIAPDHPLLPSLVSGVFNESEILSLAKALVAKRVGKGLRAEKEPEGIFTGRYIIDPIGNGELPIWVASYALAEYGTGIVKCSCHDERDFAFAKKYGIALKPVLFPGDSMLRKRIENLELCYTDMKNGVLSEPKEFEDRNARDARKEIAEYLERNKLASRQVTYRLKDWVFSRQRYWGEPIPLIHCDKCGVVPVSEKDLPVKLPKVKYYEPTGTGESPLAGIEKWVNVKCPRCGGNGRRETNTMPQWAGSSWYYIAYCISGSSKSQKPNSKQIPNLNSASAERKLQGWLPVDLYVGGAEHATRHLIYARFWHKFLQDIGIVSVPEPFMKLRPVGLIMGEDGRKMSKRFGNVINPDEIVARFGADSLRAYEMFMGPFDQQIAWSTDSLVGARRFLERVWRLREKAQSTVHKVQTKHKAPACAEAASAGRQSTRLESLLHQTIRKVGEDVLAFKFNTAVSALMILLNAFEKETSVPRDAYEILIKLLAPFAPHLSEELWEELGYKKSIHVAPWPVYDERLLDEAPVTIVVQVDGKTRGSFSVSRGEPKETLKAQALGLQAVQKWLQGREIRTVIVVPDRLVNIVTTPGT